MSLLHKVKRITELLIRCGFGMHHFLSIYKLTII